MLPIPTSSTSPACCIICSNVQILDTSSDKPTAGQDKLKRFFELLERYLDDSSNIGNPNMFGGTGTVENYDVFPFEDLINAGLTSCEQCSELVNSFSKLFHQMKVIELQLNWKVQRLKNIMLGAQRLPSRAKKFKESVKQLEMEIGISAEEIAEFKGTLIGKCRRKLGASFPWLNIKRFIPSPELEAEEKVDSDTDRNEDISMGNGLQPTLEEEDETGESRHTIDTSHVNDDWSTSSDDDYFCPQSPTLGLGRNILNDVSGPENDSDDHDQIENQNNLDILPDCSGQHSNPNEMDLDIKFDVQTHSVVPGTSTVDINEAGGANIAVPAIESFVAVKGEPLSEDRIPEIMLTIPDPQPVSNEEVTNPLPVENPSTSSDLNGNNPERPRNRDTARRKCTPLLGYGNKLLYKEKVVGEDPSWKKNSKHFKCDVCKKKTFATRGRLQSHVNYAHKKKVQQN